MINKIHRRNIVITDLDLHKTLDRIKHLVLGMYEFNQVNNQILRDFQLYTTEDCDEHPSSEVLCLEWWTDEGPKQPARKKKRKPLLEGNHGT